MFVPTELPLRRGRRPRKSTLLLTKKKIAEWVKIQEDLDLDVLVHGEFERNDMVEYFGELLSGFLFTEKVIGLQSYGTRCVKRPSSGEMFEDFPL